jgi:hypothetical protein
MIPFNESAFKVEMSRKCITGGGVLMSLILASCSALQQVDESVHSGEVESQRSSESEIMVTSLEDSGPGSLRQAILEANRIPGENTIRFDNESGPFGPPVSIRLSSQLPEIVDDLVLDGYLEGFLWKKAGVIVSGNGEQRILRVAKGARVSIHNLTLSDGKAREGGAVLNYGSTVAHGVLFENNQAKRYGGAIVNKGGQVYAINSTFFNNTAGNYGGGVANRKGDLIITNSTFSENNSKKGGGLYNKGTLHLANSILSGGDSTDCESDGINRENSTHNIVQANQNCPGVMFSGDPNLGRMDYFNGMTRTISLSSPSMALNSGDNASAVDENGEPLKWDQRGNGDPRFVAGVTDIGAFEVQAFPKLIVDTVRDDGPHGCSGARGDCPLRAALRLADLNGKPDTIGFDPMVFRGPQTLLLNRALDTPSSEIVLKAVDSVVIKVRVLDGSPVFINGVPENLQSTGVVFD